MREQDDSAGECLVARARVKAVSRGTTLEAELLQWLERYAGAADEPHDPERADVAPPPRALAPDALPARARLRGSGGRPPLPSSPGTGGPGSRQLAYRRLLAAMRDASEGSS